MGVLGREIRAIQNPALGATLIATAARGFSEGSGVHAGMPFALSFLVLPIILHAATFEQLHGTLKKSGLRYFGDKFSRSKVAQSDVLLAIQSRAISMRSTTFAALDVMLQSRLAMLDHKRAELSATESLGRVLSSSLFRDRFGLL
jgi:hypothetical protein